MPHVPCSEAIRKILTNGRFIGWCGRTGPPWGTLDQLGRHRLTKIVYAAAKAHHVQYVSTMGTLDRRERVLDGIHPNRAGSRALADRVIAALEK